MKMQAIAAICAGAFASVLPLVAGAQDKIELKATTYVPPTHGVQVDLLQPLADELAKRTNGQVTMRIFAANSPFGQVQNQADQVKNGVTDIGFGLNGVPRGRFPRTLIMDLPFMAETSDAASRAIWSMRNGLLADDYKDFKVLGLMCHNAGDFFMREKKIEKMEDVKGLRIRSPSVQVQALLQQVGAVPVTMGPGQIYESLEKGTLDGIMMVPDGVRAFRVDGLVKSWYGIKVYTTCFHFVMNPKKFDSLPPAAKQAIDELTGDAWATRFGALWNKWDEVGTAALKERGVTMTPVPADVRAKWIEATKPVIEQQLTELEGQGIKNAREIYAEMRKRVAEFSKK